MKSQLARVFVIATVACGGRGGDEPPVTIPGPTAVPSVDGQTPAVDDGNAPQPTPAPIVVADGDGMPPPIEGPLPVDDSAGTTPDVEGSRWRAPEQYVIRTCSYGFAAPSCTIEAVDGGRLVSRSNRFRPDEPWEVGSIDDGQEPVAALFEESRRRIDGCTTSFELDPVYGYPSQVYFDCEQEGWGVQVTCFEPNTLDRARCE